MKPIKKETLKKWDESLGRDIQHKTLKRALTDSDLTKIGLKQEHAAQSTFRFSKEIKTLPVTNQKKSGRCWLFAGLNVLREIIAKKYNLKSFELSQNYVAFYDKLEKINYFLESVDDFLDADKDDRTLQHIVRTGIQDGGQWDMFVSLVKKYGLVQKEAMDETTSSSNTRVMNQFINAKLRQYAAYARKHPDKKDAKKAKTLEDLYAFLVSNFGTPPESFHFEYVDKDDTYHIDTNLTPLEFYHDYIGGTLDDYVSVINAPTDDKPFYNVYTVDYLGNVAEGKQITHLNLPMDEMKELILKQLDEDEVVWFGCDVAYYGDRKKGIWADDRYDYEDIFGFDLALSKADMLDYGHSQMNHAMVLTGYSELEGNPTKWKIENSWGDKAGEKGYYLASDSWFDKYVYQAVVHKKNLTKKQTKALDKEIVHLKPWDPMGSLAL